MTSLRSAIPVLILIMIFSVSCDKSVYDDLFMGSYRVIYDDNNSSSGSVPSGSAIYNAGDVITVMDNTGSLARTGYTFSGWNTQPDGSGITYIAGSTLIMGNASIVLYALWNGNPYTVTFYANDGSGNTAAQTIICGDTVPLDANSFTRTDYSFKGWSTSSGGSLEYNDQASYTMGPGNVALYALWTALSYSVTYDRNGGSGTVPTDSITHIIGGTVTVKGLSGTGLNSGGSPFIYWSMNAGGSGTKYTMGQTFTMGSSNVILYAQYDTSRTTDYLIRDVGPTGGLIIYVATDYSNGWKYMEVSPADLATQSCEWGCYGTALIGADGIAIGTGPQNTVDIIAGCGTAGIAADLCDNFALNGYTDWFLPSFDELQLIRTNIYNFNNALGGPWNSWYYWSSSEYAGNQSDGALAVIITTGFSTGASKGDSMSVRAVRRF